MDWQFWKRSSGGVSDSVRKALVGQYKLDEGLISRLRGVEKGGHYAGRVVRHVRVFDPTLLGNGSTVRRYEDLDAHKAAILFEGHVEKDGAVYLADRRATIR